MNPKEIKILHCADLHLGAEFSTLGEKALQRKRELFFAMERIISICKDEKVEFLLIAGDLFDHIYIENQIYTDLIDQFRRIPETAIAIAPGNHDPCSADSWYYTKPWPDNVTIFNGELSCVFFEEKGVCLWGAGFTSTYRPEPFLKAEPAADNGIEIKDEYINICVLHGDLISQENNSYYNPMTIDHIRRYPFDYIALGHVHKRSDLMKMNKTHYAYPGCPEGHGFDEPGDLGVYIGMVGRGQCSLQFRKVCQRGYFEVAVPVGNLQSNQEISDLIMQSIEDRYPGEYSEHLYKIILTGEIPGSIVIDPDGILKRVESSYFFAKIEDRTTIAIDFDTLIRDQTLKGIFIQKMLAEIEKAKNAKDEKLIYSTQKALQYGLKAFEGEVGLT